MGKNIKKKPANFSYNRQGGSVYIEIRDADQRKLDTYKFGLEDKELGDRIFKMIANKYGFFIDEVVFAPIFNTMFDEAEAAANKEFLQNLGKKVTDTLKKKEANI